MAYSFAQLEALWIQAGGPASSARIAAAVALAESSGRSDAVSPSGDYGLWQINHSAHPQYDTASLLIASFNAEAAVAISNHGASWTAWCTAYTDGACGRNGGHYDPFGNSPSGRYYQAHGGTPPAPKPVIPTPKHDTPKVTFKQQGGLTGQTVVSRVSVTEAWHLLTFELGHGVPTQLHKTRNILAQIRRGFPVKAR